MNQHQPNWTNRTMWTGDNLDIMRGMNSDSVDLIYLDPPFNSNQNYSAPIGSEAAGAAFKDTWTLDDVNLAWHGEIADREPALYAVIDAAGTAHSKGMKAYAIMMAVRLLEMKRILKDTGSIYLHCDSTASHYLKLIMDAVFGRLAFRREVVWSNEDVSGFKGQARNWVRGHDTLLFYRRGEGATFNVQRRPLKEATIRRYDKTDSEGKRYKIYKYKGQERRVYLKEDRGAPMSSAWTDIPSFQQVNANREHLGYPTQKPLALLDRIIKASSNEGDMVLDPFCGCATACVAAERLNRQWAGIDLSPKAAQLVKIRIEKDNPLLFSQHPMAHRTDIPNRTDLGKLPNYRTHKHTLFGKQEGDCAGCQIAFPFRNFTIDHIVPRSKGGSDHLDNLQLLCGACNSTKGNRDQAFLVAELRRNGIL